jgi:hypothetical protein
MIERMVNGAVPSERVSPLFSLLYRETTGKFEIFVIAEAAWICRKPAENRRSLRQIPCLHNRELLTREQATKSCGSGI